MIQNIVQIMHANNQQTTSSLMPLSVTIYAVLNLSNTTHTILKLQIHCKYGQNCAEDLTCNYIVGT